MHQLARLGIILLGFYEIINGLLRASMLLSAWETVFAIIILGCLPGVLLILANRRIATAIFSSEESAVLELGNVEALCAVGFSLLGVYLLILGLYAAINATLLGTIPWAMWKARGVELAPLVARLAAPLLQSFAGLGLFLGAKRLARALSD